MSEGFNLNISKIISGALDKAAPQPLGGNGSGNTFDIGNIFDNIDPGFKKILPDNGEFEIPVDPGFLKKLPGNIELPEGLELPDISKIKPDINDFIQGLASPRQEAQEDLQNDFNISPTYPDNVEGNLTDEVVNKDGSTTRTYTNEDGSYTVVTEPSKAAENIYIGASAQTVVEEYGPDGTLIKKTTINNKAITQEGAASTTDVETYNPDGTVATSASIATVTGGALLKVGNTTMTVREYNDEGTYTETQRTYYNSSHITLGPDGEFQRGGYREIVTVHDAEGNIIVQDDEDEIQLQKGKKPSIKDILGKFVEEHQEEFSKINIQELIAQAIKEQEY